MNHWARWTAGDRYLIVFGFKWGRGDYDWTDRAQVTLLNFGLELSRVRRPWE